jgi:hypothetical protein
MADAFRIVAFILFVSLSALVVYIVVRSSAVGRARRRSEAFRSSLTAIGARAESAIAPASSQVDDVRRGLRPGRSIVADLTTARATLEALAVEAAALPPPDEVPSGGAAVAADLGRAGAAIGVVIAGCADAEATASRAGGLEAQTLVKRGYLELQHAREAVSRHVEEGVRAAAEGGRGGRATGG